MFFRLASLALLVNLGVQIPSHAQNSPPPCLPGTGATSEVYGYVVEYFVPNRTTPCHTTFRTLEEAEYALQNDPRLPSFVVGELAFLSLSGPSFFSNPAAKASLDYRPHGATKTDAGILSSSPATIETSYSLFVAGWPPNPQTVQPECAASLQVCSGGTIEGWCTSVSDAIALAQCEFDHTWSADLDWYWTRTTPAVSSGSFADITNVSVSTTNPAQGTFEYSPSSSIDPAWQAKLEITAERYSSSRQNRNATTSTGSSHTFEWNRQRRDDFTCPTGGTANSGASGSGDACTTPFFKSFIDAPSFQQGPQCGVGNPCVPGTGNKMVKERGFQYGNIDFDLYYNSLRQLRPYGYIDRNWSHTFATRLLTEWGQDHLLGAEAGIASVATVYIQNEKTQLEAYQRISSSTPGVFRSTYTVGAILRYQAATGTEAAKWLLTHSNGMVEVFDRAGRLIAILDPDDPRKDLSLGYLLPGQMDDPNTDINTDTDHLEEEFWRVSEVADGSGRSVTFTYTDPRFFWLTSIVADDGTQLMQFGYDGQHRLTSVTHAGGTRYFLYNEAENIGPSIPSYVTGYWLTGIVDEDNRRYATYRYDDWGRAVASWHGVDAGKITIDYPEDMNGNPDDGTVAVTMPLGALRTYSYNMAQPVPYRQPGSVDETGSGQTGSGQTTTVYDPVTRRVSQQTDALGTVTEYRYETSSDMRGVHQIARIEALGEPEQRRIETEWDPVTNRKLSRRLYADPTNSGAGTLETETSYTYTASGQIKTRTRMDPSTGEFRTWTHHYCDQVDPTTGCAMVGLLRQVDGPRTDVADVTTYEYYGSTAISGCGAGPGGACHRMGDLHRIVNAAGHVVEYLSYDSAGRVTRQRDASGLLTDYYYHPRGWLAKRIERARLDGVADSDDAITQLSYDASGNLIAVTQPDGVILHYQYDDAHRLTDVLDDLGNRIHYELDVAGNRVAERTYDSSYDPAQPQQGLRREMSRVYNTLGRIQQILDANGVATRVYDPASGYDGNGNPTYWTDGLGRAFANEFDPLNRLLTTWRGYELYNPGAQTEFTYNAQDNLQEVTDPDGLTTVYTYNAFGNVVKLESPDTGTTTYTYDAAGNRLSQTDARRIATTYSYDVINRITDIGYPDSTLNVAFAYDQPNAVTGCTVSYPTGRLTQMTDASGTATYCYDLRGNVTRKQHISDSTTQTTAMSYTNADRIASITYPSGAKVTYGYGALGRVTAMNWAPAPGATAIPVITSAQFLPFGPLGSLTYGNGSVLTKVYDQNYAIDLITSSISGGLTLDFEVGVMGNITYASESLVSTDPWHSYTYDALFRLTKVGFHASGLGSVQESYIYNKTGDRLSAWGSDALAGTYNYVSASHRLESVDGIARTYDAVGNTLTGVVPNLTFVYDDTNRLSVAYGTQAQAYIYGYNGNGERVGKRYITEGFNGPIEWSDTRYVYNQSGQLLGEYNDTGVTLAEYIYLGTLPVAVVKDGQLYYVLTDHLGTPRQVIEPVANTSVWEWTFFGSAFGTHTPDEDPDNDGTTFTFNLRYPGQYFDAETGLHYNYFRDYEPATGRYIESDPLGLRGGMATYAYALGSPLSWKDPKGGLPVDWFAAHCGQEFGCQPVPLWPDWGPPKCKYYDEQCGKCPSDSYACNARKCCESFGNGPSSNCTRRCLIVQDRECTSLAGGARNKCRFRKHVICYTKCGNLGDLFDTPWNNPECMDAMDGMGGPFGGYGP